nr:hypothetical protein 4 [Paracoccaceae bacterium]
MLDKVRQPKTKYELSQSILRTSNPSFQTYEVLDKESANQVKKAIDIKLRRGSFSVIILQEKGR